MDKMDLTLALPQCARKNGVLVDLFSVSTELFPRNFSECQKSQVADQLSLVGILTYIIRIYKNARTVEVLDQPLL